MRYTYKSYLKEKEERNKRLGIDEVILSDIESKQAKIYSLAVHLHVFYIDMLSILVEYLSNIPQIFDLYISIPETIEYDRNEIEAKLRTLSTINIVDIRKTPNRGRDIAPLFCTFKEELLKHDIILHLHTKKSPHMKLKSSWADYIYTHLIKEEKTVKRIFALLENYGMVTAPEFHLTTKKGWGENAKICRDIVSRIGIDDSILDQSIDFPQGSMFYTKSEYIKPLMDLNLSFDDFPEEPIAVDGTIAHAIERLFFISGASKGMKVCKVFTSNDDHYHLTLKRELFIELEKAYIKGEKHLKAIRFLTYLSIALTLGIIALTSIITI